MSGAITPAAWADMQSRAALAGLVLMRSDGPAPVLVVIDRQGAPHRLRTIDDLEDVLIASAEGATC